MAQAIPQLGSPVWNGGALGPAGSCAQQGQPGGRGPPPRAGLMGLLSHSPGLAVTRGSRSPC